MNTMYSLINIRKIVAGAGSISQLGQIAKEMDVKNAVIITDKGLLEHGVVDKPRQILEQAGITVNIISDTPPEPSLEQVNAIFHEAQAFACQLLIGIGGGSSMDTAKLVSLLLTNDVELRDLVKGKATITKRGVPTLMVPTTAGTGSEATPNAIVLVPEEELKVGIVNEKMVCDGVILDPEMTVSLPRHITANTGMDALCHAIECYISKKGESAQRYLCAKGGQPDFPQHSHGL